MTSPRPSSQYGIGILLKHLQHSLTWALPATRPRILAPPSREATPQRVKVGWNTKQEEGASREGLLQGPFPFRAGA